MIRVLFAMWSVSVASIVWQADSEITNLQDGGSIIAMCSFSSSIQRESTAKRVRKQTAMASDERSEG